MSRIIPGAGDEDVETARLHRRRDRGLDVGTRRHVAADGATSDPLRCLVRRGLVEVGDDDVGALGGQPLGRRSANALRAARDERGLTVESAHRSTRATSSATHTGLLPPSRSTVMTSVTCRPPETSSTAPITAVALTAVPTGTGAGKRTLPSP